MKVKVNKKVFLDFRNTYKNLSGGLKATAFGIVLFNFILMNPSDMSNKLFLTGNKVMANYDVSNYDLNIEDFVGVDNLNEIKVGTRDLSSVLDTRITLVGEASFIPLKVSEITTSISNSEENNKGSADILNISNIPMGEKSLPVGVDTSFKAYMDYRTITNVGSKQYKLQQSEGVYTDADGLRRYKDYYIVAVGSYYSSSVGTLLEVQLSGGSTIKCIVGDVKQDIHTDSLNQHRNGNVLEFIVDQDKLSNLVRRMGDVSYAENSNLKGHLTSIKVSGDTMVNNTTTTNVNTSETTVETTIEVTTNNIDNVISTEGAVVTTDIDEVLLGSIISEEVVETTTKEQVITYDESNTLVTDDTILGVLLSETIVE